MFLPPFFFEKEELKKTLTFQPPPPKKKNHFQRWISDTENIKTLQQLHAWVHAEHLCYSTAKQELFGSFAAANKDIDPKALASY